MTLSTAQPLREGSSNVKIEEVKSPNPESFWKFTSGPGYSEELRSAVFLSET